MGKRSKDLVTTSIYLDAVKIKGHNREIAIAKMETKKEFDSPNVIFFKALTSEVGPNAGVTSIVDDNGKIKYSTVGLSNEAIVELYMGLSHYIEKFINNQTK